MRNPLPLFLAIAMGTCHGEMSSADAIAALKAVGAEGQGNAQATSAWKTLAGRPAAELPVLLQSMKELKPVAKNYLHSAAFSIGRKAGKSLPMDALQAFLQDRKQDTQARQLAYDLLISVDSSLAEKLLPGMLKDPSSTLRRSAVQRVLDQAAKAESSDAKKKLYQEALSGAIDEDQVKKIAEELKTLGSPPNLLQHFGFLTEWKIAAPFHNVDRKGYHEEFPPEKVLDFAATYTGKDQDVKWKPVSVKDEFGMLDFNKETAKVKEVTGYAAAEFMAREAVHAELRLGCNNAWKIWLNGELVFGRDEYHRGIRIDQYKLPIQLKKGKNTLLVKCCQNEETQPWTQEWHFQLRITDLNGDAIRQ